MGCQVIQKMQNVTFKTNIQDVISQLEQFPEHDKINSKEIKNCFSGISAVSSPLKKNQLLQKCNTEALLIGAFDIDFLSFSLL